MKREKDNHNCHKIYSFFRWRFCISCKREFNFESGYVRYAGPYHHSKIAREECVCASCANNREEADKIFDNQDVEMLGNPPVDE